MNRAVGKNEVETRINELVTLYAAPDACAAHLLCDTHERGKRAYRVIAADLSVRDISYGELQDESSRFAAALASMGVRQGDRVATLMGKSRDYLVALMAIWRLGGVHVPLFTAFAPSAIAFRLLDAGAKVVLCDEAQCAKLEPGDDLPSEPPWQVVTTGETCAGTLSFRDLLASQKGGVAAVAIGGDAPLVHVYTSGTTGNPKGVVVPLKALASFRAYAEFGLYLCDDDVFWCAADPGWAYGLYFGIFATFLTGIPSLLVEANFSPELTIKVLRREQVTNFAAAPTVYRSLRASGAAEGQALALRRASSAGEPLTPEVNEWAPSALGVTVHDHFGQTEAGMLVNNHHHPALAGDLKDGSMGRSMPGWKAVILDAEKDVEIDPGQMGRLAMRLDDSELAWFRGYRPRAGVDVCAKLKASGS